ncbi:MAG TPA: 3-phosphoshikimate 1-carboxyvinyltransferase [Candidatus Baltobacteraceae bacterium]
MTVFEAGPLRGGVRVAGDKSISHRALMFAAIAHGTTLVEHPNRGADVLTTRDAVEALGARVDDRGEVIEITGSGLHNPTAVIDAGNSGTTSRLMMGLCAGQGLTVTFDGDASLRRRPMERIAKPLRAMGIAVDTSDGKLPVTVHGITDVPGGEFALAMPSAQVKSAILLANLRARGNVRVTGDAFSRDHTERMLRHFGRTIAFDGRTIVLEPGELTAQRVRVPADISAAAFFLVAAAITPGSDVLLHDVGVNPTRTGILDILKAMGADVTRENERDLDGEPVADLHVRYKPLRAATIAGELVVRGIDEVPIVAVAAAHAVGTTHIRDAADLRAKESDRLRAMSTTLAACGVAVTEHDDGLDVTGGTAHVPERTLEAFDDHRIAMAIAALAAPTGAHAVDDAACVAISYPAFEHDWRGLQQRAAPAAPHPPR